MKPTHHKPRHGKLIFAGLYALLIPMVLMGIHSCNKKEETTCTKCKQSEKQQMKTVVINDQTYTALTYNSEGYPGITSINQEEIQDISGEIMSQLEAYGITVPGCKPFALAKFYAQSIDESNTNGSSPSAVLLYYENGENQRTYAGFWKKHEENKPFMFMPGLSGINNFISPNNLFQLDQIEHLNTKEILLIVNDTKLPTTVYRTVFQIKLENKMGYDPIACDAPSGGGGPGPGPGCGWCQGGAQGMCIKNSTSGGLNPIGAFVCVFAPEDLCPHDQCMPLLIPEGYTITQEELDYLYWIRDSVLLGSEKGQQLIDDYYYSGIIMQGKIPFSLALKLYQLYRIDLFEKFPQYFMSTTYDGEVLITGQVAEIVKEMCGEARNISNDARFQSIINHTETETNGFQDKPFIEIRNAYE